MLNADPHATTRVLSPKGAARIEKDNSTDSTDFMARAVRQLDPFQGDYQPPVHLRADILEASVREGLSAIAILSDDGPEEDDIATLVRRSPVPEVVHPANDRPLAWYPF
jgi:hypothetical protein